MNDAEFETLETVIENTMDLLECLQLEYVAETGKRFVKPLMLTGRMEQ